MRRGETVLWSDDRLDQWVTVAEALLVVNRKRSHREAVLDWQVRKAITSGALTSRRVMEGRQGSVLRVLVSLRSLDEWTPGKPRRQVVTLPLPSPRK